MWQVRNNAERFDIKWVFDLYFTKWCKFNPPKFQFIVCTLLIMLPQYGHLHSSRLTSHSKLKFKKISFRDAALFASKAKINIFWKNFKCSGPKEACRVRIFFQKNVDFSFWGNRANIHTQIVYCTIFPFSAHLYIQLLCI